MSTTGTCSICGAPLPRGVLGKRCARCLLQTGLAAQLAEAQRESDEVEPAGRRFGDYELLEEIGHGGMGIVFKARQLSLDRTVAVKMLLSGAFATPEFLQRFRVEAQAAANLRHPNIVAAHDFGAIEGQPYLSMDYVPGRNLEQLTRKGPLNSRQAATYMRLIAQAVQYAHQQGILHRDLKPSNILIDNDDQPRLTDFGLAKRQAGDSSLTLTGQTLGSPNYIPPEQAGGQHARIGPASDIYSLGAVLFHLLTGRAPFAAETITATLRQVQEVEPVAPRRLNPGIPRDLEIICLKCLDKEPARRYASAAELADELGRFLNGEPIRARPVSPATRVWRWVRRNPRLAGVIGVAAFVVLVVSGIAAWRIGDARDQERLETYASSIELADRYIRDGSIDQALELLYNKCPSQFRHWEWGHLLYLCHQEVLTIRAHADRPQVLDAAPYVQDLAFDPSGTRLRSLGKEGDFKVWDLTDGRLLFAWTNQAVTAWAEHPRGLEIALGLTNGIVRIFDAATWREGPSVIGPWGALTNGEPASPPVNGLAYHPSGQSLAIVTGDGQVRLWDRSSNQPLFTSTNGPVGALWTWFTPDGRELIIQSQRAVHRLDAKTGHENFRFARGADEYWAVFADRSGQNLATVDLEDRVQLWSGNNPTHFLDKLNLDRPEQRVAVFSPDGRLVCTAGDQGSARLYDVATGQGLFSFPGRVYHVGFNVQGTRLAVTGAERLVHIWDIGQRRELLVLRGHLSHASKMAHSLDGRLIAVAGEDGLVKIWSANPGREQFPAEAWQWACAYSPDGRRLTVHRWWDDLRVWNADSGRLELILKSRSHFAAVAAFSPDGRRIVSVGSERIVRVWDAIDGNLIQVFRGHRRSPLTVAYSPDGRRIATGDIEGIVKIWDAESGRELHSLEGHARQTWDVSFDPTSRWLAVAGNDSAPRVWDVESGTLRFALYEAKYGGFSIGFSPPDGQTIAALGKDRRLRIWDARSGRLLHDWPSRGMNTSGLSFSPDGRRLAVGVADRSAFGTERGTLELWDLEHGRTLLNLRNHTDPLNFVRFSPDDGNRLLTAAMDFATRQEEAFPWDEARYPGPPGTSLPERVQAYSREYWRARLAAEHDAAVEAAPRVSSRDSDESLLPRRDKEAGTNLIDLSGYYNTRLDSTMIPNGALHSESDNDLAALKPGLLNLGGVPFDVRGVVLLRRRDPNGRPWQKMWDRYPERVTGLPVGGRVQRLHILHGASEARGVQDGTPVASLVWHFVNGAQRETGIVYGRDVRDWWLRSHWIPWMMETVENTLWGDPRTESERGRVVWTGDNPVAQEAGATLRLYLTTYENPQPELEVTSLDYVSKFTQVAPFLIALTVEP